MDTIGLGTAAVLPTATLDTLLAEARTARAMTLWHLLAGSARPLVDGSSIASPAWLLLRRS